MSAGWDYIIVGAGSAGWHGNAVTGSVDADPYSRAVVARSGIMPLGLGEGLAFTARRDGAGWVLDGAKCVVPAGDEAIFGNVAMFVGALPLTPRELEPGAESRQARLARWHRHHRRLRRCHRNLQSHCCP